jgi:hypothetical protein
MTIQASVLSLSRIQIQDDSGGVQSTGQYHFPFSSITEYLKLRHGFSTSFIDNWHPELHVPPGMKKLLLVHPEIGVSPASPGLY